jgi:hypothetical protein
MSLPLLAQELARLDSFETEDISNPGYLVNLYLTENCSVCQQQIEVIQGCVVEEKVAAFIKGPNEEKLRTYVKRKKIPFKTYLLNEAAKNDLGFGDASPSISIKAVGKLKNYVGLQSCDQITKAIRFGNSDQHK